MKKWIKQTIVVVVMTIAIIAFFSFMYQRKCAEHDQYYKSIQKK